MQILKNICFRFQNGVKEIFYEKEKRFIFIVAVLFFCLKPFQYIYYLILPENFISKLLFVPVTYLVLFLLIIMLGTPKETFKFSDGFYKIGFYNKAYEIPKFLNKKRPSKKTDIIIYSFYSPYFALSDWENMQGRIETLLGRDIVKIEFAKGNKRNINIYTRNLNNFFSKTLFWNDDYLVRDDKTFILGISILGATVSWSLNMYVNALIAGATGSGKSAVFRLICYQAIRKGMLVYIASFKGGFDFNITWRKGCKIITHEKEFLNTLNLILLEKEKRTELLLAAGCVDIDEYNSESTKKLKRIFLALDEAAELLDKDGLKKSTDGEKLELLKEIEQKLTSLSRTGRAFGIHMVFATQKPSATIINGQIKSNLEARMCGSSDNILSQMVLDNNCASEMIPSGSKGVFIDQSRIMFKAYLLDEENLSF